MNTKSQIKRLMVILMAGTLALTGMAVGYGLWQDTIDIQVTTTTTVLDFTCYGFVDVTTDDKGPPFLGDYDHTVVSPIYYYDGDTYRVYGFTTEDNDGDGLPESVDGEVAKNVGWTNAVGVNLDKQCGGEQVIVTVGNGYPSYASVTTVGFKNFGPDTAVFIDDEGIDLPASMTAAGYYLQYYSPPVAGIQSAKCYVVRKKAGPGLVGEDPSNDPLDIEDTVPPGPYTFGDGEDNDGDGVIDEDPAVLDLCWINYEGETVQPTETTVGSLKLHVLQPAEQGAEYKFTVWVLVVPG